MNKIVALVVTYNRKKILEENIQALLNQTFNKFDILIVDNNSTDGTEIIIKKYQKNNENIIYKNTGANLGGAGGFSFGLKTAIELGYEICWLMDDDTIPYSDSLQVLVETAKKINNEFSFLCSYVEWTDHSPCKMNQVVQKKAWYNSSDKLHDLHLLELLSCSFVSVYINLSVAKKAGLPVRQMFIYGDDHEYTYRLSKYKPGYFAIDSIVLHKMAENRGYSVENVPENKISRYFYDSRNRFYTARKTSLLVIIKYLGWLLVSSIKIIFKSNKKFKRLFVIWKGFLFGFFFNPKIEYVRSKNI